MAAIDNTAFYKALGVNRTATADELKAAVRLIQTENHLDRNPGNAEAEKRFKAATEAYDVLKDPELRAGYDLYGRSAIQFGKVVHPVKEAAYDPTNDAFWQHSASNRAPPPPPPRNTQTPPPPPPRGTQTPPSPRRDPVNDRQQFDTQLRSFTAVGTKPQMRETLASELFAALRKHPEWKSEQAVHRTIIDHTLGLSSPAMRTLFDDMIKDNPQGARYYFDNQLTRLNQSHIQANAREASATNLAALLKTHPEWKSEPRVYETIIFNTAGFNSPAMKTLFDTTLSDNPAAEKHHFDTQFKKFASPTSLMKVKVFIAPELAASLVKHPDWVDTTIVNVVDAVNKQTPVHLELLTLQKTVHAIMAAKNNPGPSQNNPQRALPKPSFKM